MYSIVVFPSCVMLSHQYPYLMVQHGGLSGCVMLSHQYPHLSFVDQAIPYLGVETMGDALPLLVMDLGVVGHVVVRHEHVRHR